MRLTKDNKGDCGGTERGARKQTAHPTVVRPEGYCKSDHVCNSVRWDSEELSSEAMVPETSHNDGGEQGKGCRSAASCEISGIVHPESHVCERRLCVLPVDPGLAVRVVTD